jgi:succinate dehydrogenase / fumarate reductase flavoprotein subunit
LGGNSLLGAIYGGLTAAKAVCEDCGIACDGKPKSPKKTEYTVVEINEDELHPAPPALISEISDILYRALGIVRNEADMQAAEKKLGALADANRGNVTAERRIRFAKMMLASALFRTESRGAHYRSDYPQQNEKFQRYVKCDVDGIIDAWE